MNSEAGGKYLYGRDDRPSMFHGIAVGAQHAMLALVFLVYPLAVAQQIGLSPLETREFLTGCVLSIAMGTALHVFRPSIGSGSLAIEIPTPIFLPAAVLTGGAGGLAMLSGMSLICGIIECVFARLLRYVRGLFPAEVCGVSVMMLGFSLIRPGVVNSLGLGSAMVVDVSALIVATGTISTIAAIAIFGTGMVRLFALGGGLLVGVGLSALLGVGEPATLQTLSAATWLGVPEVHIGMPRMDLTLLALCVVMSLVLSVDNLGMLIGIQRQQNPDWNKIDLKQAAGGIQVSGIADMIAGVFGGMPTGISSANVSLAHATGVIARRISVFTGILLLVAGCSNKVITALSLVPHPVVGAIMIYAAAYMLVSGMTLIMGRLLTERRIFMVGFSVVVGLSPALVPGVFSNLPVLLRPLVESPLALGTFSAILMTLVFRFGAARKTALVVELAPTDNEALREFHFNKAIRDTLVGLGSAAGAARALVDRAIDVTSELVSSIASRDSIASAVSLSAAFEDERLEIVLEYNGRPVTVGAASSEGAATGRPSAGTSVSRGAAVDKVRVRSDGDRQHLSLVFES